VALTGTTANAAQSAKLQQCPDPNASARDHCRAAQRRDERRKAPPIAGRGLLRCCGGISAPLAG
jgi:hypothetical protein